ncbi:MAG TPA: adenylosuccinate synthetase [Chitinophagaceae bacterium]|nr:adenylosuccinate synthetase [Chitinophagaceae bacterium]
MKTIIITGLGFGDEGKGLATDYLSHHSLSPVVIRFNGGHQAGHTVVTADGRRHVFSSLGSGSFRGAPTYWSRYCTFYPNGFLNEYHTLRAMNVRPVFYLDYLSPVTTFYDVIYNRALEESRSRHGSCGLGFGATIERHESFPKLFAQDMLSPRLLRLKLDAVERYYREKVNASGWSKLSEFYFNYDFEKAKKLFMEAAAECVEVVRLVNETAFFNTLKEKDCTCIFEGAQGILLDMDFGFFPHVTRSYTTSRNAMELITTNKLPMPAVYYITRAYQSRHGAGPMTNEDMAFNLIENEQETNVFNPWQGNFRKSVLDLDLLKHAILSDSHYSGMASKSLIITCLDQLDGQMNVTKGGVLSATTPSALAEELLPQHDELLLSYSDVSERMEAYRHPAKRKAALV